MAFNYWEATIRCPQNLLFSRLNGALQGQIREGQLFPSPCWTPLISCNPERPAGTHCWLRQSFWSTRTPKSFSAGLLSRSSSPSLYVYPKAPRSAATLSVRAKGSWKEESPLSLYLCFSSKRRHCLAPIIRARGGSFILCTPDRELKTPRVKC